LAETNRGRAQRIAGLIPAQIDEITGDSDAFWLIVVMDHNLEYQQQIVDQFDSDFTRLQHLTIHDVDILQYSISPSG
jgi:hypothetical protein